jgi:hypothetical protein
MAFWSTNDVEPKRNFRFQVQIKGLTDLGAPTDILWWAKTVTTPSFDVSEVEHNYLDNKFYFPGRVSWNEVTLTLVDPITVDAVQLTNRLLEASGYSVKSNEMSVATMSKIKATSTALQAMIITILNADGDPIEQWQLNNPFIKSAKYGDLDYSSEDLRTVEMTIRYDWATCSNDSPLQFEPK